MEKVNDQLYNQYFVEIDILNQFEAIFKYANEGIVITDDQSRILKINPSVLQTFGYEYEKEIIDFNYITAIISFIVTAGISYIFLNRKSNNTN